MKLLSLNAGKPQDHEWNGRVVRTGIFKTPVEGKRKISFFHVEGDDQADLRVHGGTNKAVYAYDVSHYAHWKGLLQRQDWPYGLFGENLTTEGLLDSEAKIGDVYRISTAILQVVQPRFPCTKLNIRFGVPDMMERFMEQQRNGIYFKVLEEGFVEKGDTITLTERSPYPVTIQDYVNCYYAKGKNKTVVETILSIPFIPESQRKVFETFL